RAALANLSSDEQILTLHKMEKVIHTRLCSAFPDFPITLKSFHLQTIKLFQEFKHNRTSIPLTTVVSSAKTKWDDEVEKEFLTLIADCDRELALSSKKQNFNYLKLLFSKFCSTFPNLKLAESTVKKKYYALKNKSKS